MSHEQELATVVSSPVLSAGFHKWRSWFSNEHPDKVKLEVVVGILGSAVAALGASNDTEVAAACGRALTLEPAPLPALPDVARADVAAAVLLHYLDADWLPPVMPTGGVILQPAETIFATAVHERWVYNGAAANYYRGGVLAFGNPLFVGASLVGSVALSAASRRRAEKRASVQWRSAGHGRLVITNQRVLFAEGSLTALPVNALAAVEYQGPDLYLACPDSPPSRLMLGDTAPLHAALVRWLATRRAAEAVSAAHRGAETVPATDSPSSPLFSPDRQHWWDGRTWVDATQRIPPGAVRSPDLTQWHDGMSWRQVPDALTGS